MPGIRWSPEADAQLRLLWGDGLTLATIARRLGRTRKAVYKRATEDLGLPGGAPQGFEMFSAAVKRSGFSHRQLLKILEQAKVQLYSVRHDPSRRSKLHQHFVDPVAVDEAIAAWNQMETVAAAARRVGVGQMVLLRGLRHAGITKPGDGGSNTHFRVTDEQVQRALASRRPSGSVPCQPGCTCRKHLCLARSPAGELNPRAKLKASDLPVIRQRLAAGERGAALAREYNVAPTTISAVKRTATWAPAVPSTEAA